MGVLCHLSINFQPIKIKFLIKTINIVIKISNMELGIRHSLKFKLKTTNQIMIKLRSRLLRLATVSRVMITGQNMLTSSHVISCCTGFDNFLQKSQVDQQLFLDQWDYRKKAQTHCYFEHVTFNWTTKFFYPYMYWISP